MRVMAAFLSASGVSTVIVVENSGNATSLTMAKKHYPCNPDHPSWRDPFAACRPPYSTASTPSVMTWETARYTPAPLPHSPYATHDPRRESYGDRLHKAAAVSNATVRACGGVWSFGDFSFCAQFLPQETACATAKHAPCGPPLKGVEKLKDLPEASGLKALSYGIRERDFWSEWMSNRYAIRSRLYDCFWFEARGPMNTNLSAGALGQTPCPSWRRTQGCYDAPYEARHVCLGETTAPMVALHTTKGKQTVQFQTLEEGLRNERPLSVYLKLDIEGSEWLVLDQFLQRDEDVAKVRTLQLEVHLNRFSRVTNATKSPRDRPEDQLDFKVGVVERLAEKFAVYASTIQTLHNDEEDRLYWEMQKNPNYTEPEPVAYTSRGFRLDQYCLSLVNRALLAGAQ